MTTGRHTPALTGTASESTTAPLPLSARTPSTVSGGDSLKGVKVRNMLTCACRTDGKFSWNSTHESSMNLGPKLPPGRGDLAAPVVVADRDVRATWVDATRVGVETDQGADRLVLEVEDRRPWARGSRRRGERQGQEEREREPHRHLTGFRDPGFRHRWTRLPRPVDVTGQR